jgi:hypothetical protein
MVFVESAIMVSTSQISGQIDSLTINFIVNVVKIDSTHQ